jgi:hypothetical protein
MADVAKIDLDAYLKLPKADRIVVLQNGQFDIPKDDEGRKRFDDGNFLDPPAENSPATVEAQPAAEGTTGTESSPATAEEPELKFATLEEAATAAIEATKKARELEKERNEINSAASLHGRKAKELEDANNRLIQELTEERRKAAERDKVPEEDEKIELPVKPDPTAAEYEDVGGRLSEEYQIALEEYNRKCNEILADIVKEERKARKSMSKSLTEAENVAKTVKEREAQRESEAQNQKAYATVDLIAETFGIKTTIPWKEIDRVAAQYTTAKASGTPEDMVAARTAWNAIPPADQNSFDRLVKANKLAAGVDVKSKQFKYKLLAEGVIDEDFVSSALGTSDVDLDALAEKQRQAKGIKPMERVDETRLNPITKLEKTQRYKELLELRQDPDKFKNNSALVKEFNQLRDELGFNK